MDAGASAHLGADRHSGTLALCREPLGLETTRTRAAMTCNKIPNGHLLGVFYDGHLVVLKDNALRTYKSKMSKHSLLALLTLLALLALISNTCCVIR